MWSTALHRPQLNSVVRRMHRALALWLVAANDWLKHVTRAHPRRRLSMRRLPLFHPRWHGNGAAAPVLTEEVRDAPPAIPLLHMPQSLATLLHLMIIS
jgi:hypothetical protein